MLLLTVKTEDHNIDTLLGMTEITNKSSDSGN